MLALVRERYPDFGATLATEKLAERHGLTIGVETLRQWMMAEGLWIDRRHRLPSPHQPRRRRECLGELVQIDGSEHAWFEDRAPMCTLLGPVDKPRPDANASEQDESDEAGGELVISGGDAPLLLEMANEALNP